MSEVFLDKINDLAKSAVELKLVYLVAHYWIAIETYDPSTGSIKPAPSKPWGILRKPTDEEEYFTDEEIYIFLTELLKPYTNSI